MRSKYDDFWAGLLPQVRAEVQLASTGSPAAVAVPGLTRLGARQSWYGTAEIRARKIISSSGAHATSLAEVVRASGICDQWPQYAFRFAVSPAGDVLTIAIADHTRQRLPPPRTPRTQPGTGQPPEKPPSAPPVHGAGHGRSPGVVGGRGSDTGEFYWILDELATRAGGPRRLRDHAARSGCPPQGLYFFYEDSENRGDGGPRVVRIGTHALTATSKATLWGRLSQHRGQLAGRNPGGGNHRGSVFRRHVGAALIRRDGLPDDLLTSWLDRHRPPGQRASREDDIEREVSRYIRAMPFLWLNVPDRADRAYLESNSIALLSCLTGSPDLPSVSWLGHHAERAEIPGSGLWNVQHVSGRHEPAFLQRLAHLVKLQQ